MAGNKTQGTDIDPYDFIQNVEPQRRRDDARVLLDLFAEVTGFKARMWGPTIVGFGQYHYTYESGREGDMCATGFSPRKAKMVIYILPGYTDFGDILDRIGKYSKGKSCLYINKLDDVDLGVLRELIQAGLKDLNKTWPVTPS